MTNKAPTNSHNTTYGQMGQWEGIVFTSYRPISIKRPLMDVGALEVGALVGIPDGELP